MKRNVCTNMLKVAEQVSSPEHTEYSKTMCRNILQSNGYRDGCLPNFSYNRLKYVKGNVTVKIPFISEKFTSDFSRLVFDSGLPLNIVVSPPPNLKALLTNSRYHDRKCANPSSCIVCPEAGGGACLVSGSVYKIECECGDFYIGETGRPLYMRIQEHLRSCRNPSCPSYVDKLLAKQRVASHASRMPSLKVKILESCRDKTQRKILEAFQIKKQHPPINSREEMATALSLIDL